jgi:ribosomal protein S18 acetylase RimI-like enzyme
MDPSTHPRQTCRVIHIRPAHPDDLPQMVSRWTELVAAHAALSPDLYALTEGAPGTWRAMARRQMGDSDGLALVAVRRGEIEGYLLGGVGRRAPYYAVREVGMIFDLAVRPASRRAGIGASLAAAARTHFKTRGVRWLQVNVSPDNPGAAGFWQTQGFKTLLTEAYLQI